MEIIELLLEYAAIWAPSLVSICAVIGSVIGVCSKGAAAVQKIEKSTQLQAVRAQLKETRLQLAEQNRLNGLLVDKITKIEGYSDATVKKN